MIQDENEINPTKQYHSEVDDHQSAISATKHRHVKYSPKNYELVQQDTFHEIEAERRGQDDNFSGIERLFPAPLEIDEIDQHEEMNEHSQNDELSSTSFQTRARYISALSNISVQYNLGVIAPALLLLDPGDGKFVCFIKIYPTDFIHLFLCIYIHLFIFFLKVFSPSGGAAYPCTSESRKSLLKSIAFIGAIIGQSSFGIVGDVIGIAKGLMISNTLIIIGAFLSTISPCLSSPRLEGNMNTLYIVLVVARAVLGVGIGGNYPLASAFSAEAADSSTSVMSSGNRAREVANGFFWQTPGAIMPYVVSLALLLVMGEDSTGRDKLLTTNFQYVVLCGIGIIPSLITLILVRSQEQHAQLESSSRKYDRLRHERISLKVAIRDKQNQMNLFGCSICWFLYDVILYGTSVNLPQILSFVFAKTEDLIVSSWHDLIVSLVGIPGILCALYSLDYFGVKHLQIAGFTAIGIASAALSLSISGILSVGRLTLVFFCCTLMFSLNWGCSLSTYVLPMEVFDRNIRSSFHGLSAAGGKLGGFIGEFFLY